MAVVDTTILELLGKQVSFTRSFETDNFYYSIDYSGTVTAVVISLSEEPQFFVDDQGSFFSSNIRSQNYLSIFTKSQVILEA